MATALISTSLVLGLGFGVSSCTARTPRTAASTTGCPLWRRSSWKMSPRSQKPRTSLAQKLGSSFKQLYSVRKALPAIAKKTSRGREAAEQSQRRQRHPRARARAAQHLHDPQRRRCRIRHRAARQVADLSSALPPPIRNSMAPQRARGRRSTWTSNAVQSANQQPAPPPAQPAVAQPAQPAPFAQPAHRPSNPSNSPNPPHRPSNPPNPPAARQPPHSPSSSHGGRGVKHTRKAPPDRMNLIARSLCINRREEQQRLQTLYAQLVLRSRAYDKVSSPHNRHSPQKQQLWKPKSLF